MHFEPALIPVQPGKLSVDVLYRVPVSIMSRLIEGQLIRVVIDAPYNVRDVRKLHQVYCLILQIHACTYPQAREKLVSGETHTELKIDFYHTHA